MAQPSGAKRRGSRGGRAGTRVSLAAAGLATGLAACDSTTGPEPTSCPPTAFDPALTIQIGPPPPGRLSLAPGEACILRNARVATLAAGPEPRDYLIAVQSASHVAGAVARLGFAVLGPDADRQAAAAPAIALHGRTPPVPPDVETGSRLELDLRAAARRELERAGARPARPGGRGPVARAARLERRDLAPGDTVRFRNSVSADLEVSCESEERVTAVVRALGPGFALVEDVAVAGHLTAAQFDEIRRELQDVVFPVVTGYFGEPADLDGNGVVWVLLTAVVNRLTPRGSATRIGGFHNPTDLADPQACPASNRGEILYLLGADPNAVFSDALSAEFIRRNTLGVTAHEMHHLISAELRTVVGTGDFSVLEESWLGEGLAHTAETVAGLARSGLSLGAALGFAELAGDSDAFRAYHFDNFRRAAWYASSPEETAALGDTARADPGGIPSLRMRGFAWLFLRWLADQFVAGGGGPPLASGERALFRELSHGGPRHAIGIANVERAVATLGPRALWRDLLAQYAAVPVVAGAARVAPAERLRLRSFDLRDIYAGLHSTQDGKTPFAAPYPLRVTNVDLDRSTEQVFALELGASTASYFMLGSEGPHPPISLRLTGSGGGPLPAEARAQMTVIRTR